MPVPVYEPTACSARVCKHTAAASEDGWHPLVCMTGSVEPILRRHNAVVGRLAHFARMLNVQPRIEPAGLHADDDRRPDIQLDLPEATLLGDVTVSHPLAKSWRKLTASRGVEAVGDAREAEKNGLYADMAEECHMEFCPVVLYTYGGFHASTLTFITRMAKALDPATCLTSAARWKDELLQHIAIAVQRGNADIMVQAERRARGRRWPRRRRGISASAARHIPRPRGRGGREVRDGGDDVRRQGPGSCAMAHVARLLGLPDDDYEADDQQLGSGDEASEAATQRMADEAEAGVVPSSLPSVIPETPETPQPADADCEQMRDAAVGDGSEMAMAMDEDEARAEEERLVGERGVMAAGA